VNVDRWLCSWNWIEPAFSRFLFAELIRPGLRALPPTYGADFVALARHAVAARRHRRNVIVVAIAEFVALAAVVPIVLLEWFRTGATIAVAALSPVVAVLALPVLVGTHLYVSRSRASNVLFSRLGPRAKVPALDPPIEARLSEISDANAVVFGTGNPFVGAGARLDRWKLRIDTTRAATDRSGAKRRINPLTSVQLQKELTTTVRSAGIPNLEVHNRLFVDGDFAFLVPGLLPDRSASPKPVIKPAEIRQRIDDSSENARTYLCVEKRSWYGELVVTIFVRVSRELTDLFVEFQAFVILPLASEVRVASAVPVSRPSRIVQAIRDAVPTTYRLVRFAHRNGFRLLRWRYALARRVSIQRRMVRRMSHFNYGALRGVQSILAASQRDNLFIYEDEDTYLQSLRARLLATIVKTVDDHGIDTSDLERQQRKIVNKIYRIGKIKGRNVVIGDHNSFSRGLPGVMNDEPEDELVDYDDDEDDDDDE
jgi:hypothetical protein